MNREYHRWFSPSLGRDMELLVFGHAGARVIIFPTSHGSFFEWEDRDMMRAIGDFIDRGWFQVFCVDDVNRESWYARGAHPAVRAARHNQYDAYLVNEVLPFTTWKNPNPFLVLVGASFGAYQAMNFGLRHPEKVGRILGLSGLYDIKELTGGYSDANVYFNNPCDFLMHEHDPGRLEAIRRMDVVLATGRDDPHRANNEYLSSLLWSKGVWHALRLWDGFSHDWPYWQKMIRLYIGGHD